MADKKFIQYLKWLPAKLGLINKTTFILKLNKIKNNDVFLVSFPKSGNTWLRFIVANLLTKNELITLQNIDAIVPDIYSSSQIANKMSNQRYIKTHHACFNDFPKTVYICRDYRDAMVSNYHYFKNRRNFNGSFSDFINTKVAFKDFGSWSNHVKSAIKFKNKFPNRIILLRYEDLLQNPTSEIQKIIDFLAIKPKRAIEEVVDLCSFNNLRQNENTFNGNYKKLTGHNFFREGKVEQWKNYFTDMDIMMLKNSNDIIEAMHLLGYKI